VRTGTNLGVELELNHITSVGPDVIGLEDKPAGLVADLHDNDPDHTVRSSGGSSSGSSGVGATSLGPTAVALALRRGCGRDGQQRDGDKRQELHFDGG